MEHFPKRWIVLLAGMLAFSLACSLLQAQPPEALTSTPSDGGAEAPAGESGAALEQPEGGAAAMVSALLGGELALETPGGDSVRLSIPPFALEQDTRVSLIYLSNAPDSPFAQIFLPGLAIEPDGLQLRLPARLTITLTAAAPGPARLFYLKQPDLALPLWQSQAQGNAISGRIMHFSQYVGGVPSGDEASSQSQAAGELGGDFPSGWQDDFEGNQALQEWGNVFNDLGMGGDAQSMLNEAHDRVAQDLACLMDPDCNIVPLDPCGEYQQMLMQLFQQATLLAFDPESAEMSFLEDELTRVLNECTNRYTLEYNHNLNVNQGGLQQKIQVTGKVIFTAPMYGVFELGEPLKMEGSGPVDVTISGQTNADDKICTIQGSGTNQVTITGELVADEMGNPWLDLQVSETWYTSGSMTFSCPEDDYAKTIPLPATSGQEFPLRFQYEDGAKSMAPNLGGMQGEYNWILHILHTW